MSAFRDLIEADNEAVFLNLEEFGEYHELQETRCVCILQGDTVLKTLSTGGGASQTYPMVYGVDLTVNVKTADLPEIPVYGQLFSVDDEHFLVQNVKDDMGMLTIELVANDR